MALLDLVDLNECSPQVHGCTRLRLMACLTWNLKQPPKASFVGNGS